MKDNSIYDTLKETSMITQSTSGIGLSIHNIRVFGFYLSFLI